MQFEQVKAIIKQECKENGIIFFQGKGVTVRFIDGVRSNGYFDDGKVSGTNQPKLAVATNQQSLEVLVHEYCHMRQYLERAKVWQDLGKSEIFWNWLTGDDRYSEEQVIEGMIASYNVEVDCEKRSVEQHKKWGTGINLTEYIQKANAYTMFYFYVLDERKWYKSGREPYTLKEVWSKMPKSFTFDVEQCYNKHRQLFDLCV